MDYKQQAKLAKQDSFLMAALPEEVRNLALLKMAEALEANKEAVFAANEKDLAEGKDLPAPLLARLRFDAHKLEETVAELKGVRSLPDPVGKVDLRRQLSEGLILERVSCPIGVIGVIFESRPDALVQITGLGVKSGNCVILKGGSEAKHTNKALFDVLHEAGVAAGLPEAFATQVEDRAAIDELLTCHEDIDLIIPRGSNAFVQYIMERSRIPVMGHADGICHIYVDKEADLDKAIPVIVDAKTQYVAVCNAVETLLVHKDVAEELLPRLAEAMPNVEIIPAKGEEDFVEYLDYKVTAKVVEDLKEAIDHINRYGSHHTDAILTENEETAETFMHYVDSAGVYWNCSTRFADGFRYGFGAEVGIATGKLHARGPVGLDGLATYKYKLRGHGQIVGDFASGKCAFDFKDL